MPNYEKKKNLLSCCPLVWSANLPVYFCNFSPRALIFMVLFGCLLTLFMWTCLVWNSFPGNYCSIFLFLQEDYDSSLGQEYESICWGCGLRLILPSNAPIFKCGWCGAITKQNACKREVKNLLWKRIRDRCFLGLLFIFMVFLICMYMFLIFYYHTLLAMRSPLGLELYVISSLAIYDGWSCYQELKEQYTYIETPLPGAWMPNA